MQYIEEWQPVDFSTVNGKLALVLIFALLAAALFSRRPWRLDEVLLTAFALWVCAVACAVLVLRGPGRWRRYLRHDLKLFPPYEREMDKPWLNASIMAAVVGAIIFFFPSTAELQQKVDEAYPQSCVGVHAAAASQAEGSSTSMRGAGIWNGIRPQLKPFIDGRADIFIYNGSVQRFSQSYCDKRNRSRSSTSTKSSTSLIPPKPGVGLPP